MEPEVIVAKPIPRNLPIPYKYDYERVHPVHIPEGKDAFDLLMENATSMPEQAKQEIRDVADTLITLANFSRQDICEASQFVMQHLPDVREARANQFFHEPYQPGWDGNWDAHREAVRIKKSAEKLRKPDRDEQYAARAAVVETSILLKSALRQTPMREPELDPVHLSRFRRGMKRAEQNVPRDVATSEDRVVFAKMQFVQELRAADNDVVLAVKNFYRNQTLIAFDRERGHWNDQSIAQDGEEESKKVVKLPEQDTFPSPLDEMVQKQDALENPTMSKIMKTLPEVAAQYLKKPKEYLAFRVMQDNSHLMNWKVREDSRIRFTTINPKKDDPESTITKILKNGMGYEHLRGASLLIESTLEKLNTLMREHGDKEIQLSPQAEERMQKSTAELMADPAVKAIKVAPKTDKDKDHPDSPTPPRGKGKGQGI